MHMTRENWESLNDHLFGSGIPPAEVFTTVAALTGTSKILESVVGFDPAPESIWRIYALTEKCLVHVVVRYEAEHYNLDESQEPRYRSTPVVHHVDTAWMRPLTSVTEISVGSVGILRDLSSTSQWYPASLAILFSDGFRVELPAQDRSFSQGRERSDRFLVALRDSVAAGWGIRD